MFTRWQAVELLAFAYYAERGFRILVPLIESCAYDFVAERDGVFLRVNAKLSGRKKASQINSWSISIASGASDGVNAKEPCDVFLAWLPEHKKFVELPGTFFDGLNSKSRIIPQHLYR